MSVLTVSALIFVANLLLLARALRDRRCTRAVWRRGIGAALREVPLLMLAIVMLSVIAVMRAQTMPPVTLTLLVTVAVMSWTMIVGCRLMRTEPDMLKPWMRVFSEKGERFFLGITGVSVALLLLI